MNAEASHLAELRERERRLDEMLRGMEEKAARLARSRKERQVALENLRIAIARLRLRGSCDTDNHGSA